MLNGLFPNYKVYCTQEQLNKAISLGASFETNAIPDVEQMINWLETQGIHIYAYKTYLWSCHCYRTNVTIWEIKNYNCIFNMRHISSKEVILAGIDAVLEYLINNKK